MRTVHQVTDTRRAESLARLLNSSERTRPVVVVSTSSGAGEPWIDAERIAAEVGEYADVYVLAHDCSWHFTLVMPPSTQVYGGAGRVYPTDLEWVRDPFRSRLRFAYDPGQGEAATTALIDDTLAAAHEAGLLDPGPQVSATSEVNGRVIGCPTPSQAMLDTDTGYATVQVGIAFPGVTSDRVFLPGMRVRGNLDPRTRRLDIRGFLPTPSSRVDDLADGDVVPARVESVTGSACVLAIHPQLQVDVSREQVTSNGTDDLRDFMSVGDVVAVEVGRGPGGSLSLSMLDVDPSRCRPAPALLPGGPPWLPAPEVVAPLEEHVGDVVPSPPPARPWPTGRPVSATAPAGTPVAGPGQDAVPDVAPPADREPPGSPSAPVRGAPQAPPSRPTPMLLARRSPVVPGRGRQPLLPGPSPDPSSTVPEKKVLRDMGLALEAARNAERLATTRLRHAQAELALLQHEMTVLTRELQAREHSLRTLRRRHHQSLQSERSSSRQPPAGADDLFPDPADQFRFEVYVRWARRIPAGEKTARPLRDYSLGPQFLSSLREMQGVDRSKVLDVVVEVLTGIAETSPGREMHPLRTGAGGSDEICQRDGYTCWRVALQRQTPGARRLHFWRRADHIELSRIVLHDDFTP
jgi:hypothetical protein